MIYRCQIKYCSIQRIYYHTFIGRMCSIIGPVESNGNQVSCVHITRPHSFWCNDVGCYDCPVGMGSFCAHQISCHGCRICFVTGSCCILILAGIAYISIYRTGCSRYSYRIACHLYIGWVWLQYQPCTSIIRQCIMGIGTFTQGNIDLKIYDLTLVERCSQSSRDRSPYDIFRYLYFTC